MSANDNLPDRQDYIIAEALAFSIEALKLLPMEHRPDSNIEDMQRLLRSRAGSTGNLELHQSLAHDRLQLLASQLRQRF